jgi:hypothetical protein
MAKVELPDVGCIIAVLWKSGLRNPIGRSSNTISRARNATV